MRFLNNSQSLKYKLAISHISMIIIPLLLFAGADLIWHHIINARFISQEKPQLENILIHNRNIVAELDELIADNPDRLADANYLRQLNQKATGHEFLFVIVEKNASFICVPENIDKLSLKASRMEIKNEKAHDSQGYIFLKYCDFKFTDQSNGQIYFLTLNNPHGPDIDVVLIIALLFGMIINIFISYRVAKNIITPLGILGEATTEIAQGNLDSAIEYSSHDELGELCDSFEKMRLQLKEAQNLSQSYEKNRKELIANISHDLKTPITSIRGYVQGLMEGVANTPEKESKYIYTIYNNAIQMDRLIDELFLFSKLDLNQLEFDFEDVDIGAYLHDCVEDKGYDLDMKGIKLIYSPQYNSSQPVWADRLRLQRVINNIIVNAEQHMDPAKSQALLEIILSENNDEAIVEIKDNGTGIAAEKLPYIFDRLYRGDPSRNRQNNGSGLGLSIARQIIEAHSGRIWVKSEINVGTSIIFTLRKVDTMALSINKNNSEEINA